MKKTILQAALFAAVACSTTYAQDEEPTSIFNRKHEIKLGAVKALAGPIVEGTYEYIKSPYFTFGASVLGNLDQDNDWPEDFSVTPFVRFYFNESKEYGAKGFFVEGFGKFLTGRDHYYYSETYYDQNGSWYYEEERNEKYTAGSVGVSLGWKWVNHTGFVFEVLAGGGRNFGSNNAPEATFRGDLNIGYRF